MSGYAKADYRIGPVQKEWIRKSIKRFQRRHGFPETGSIPMHDEQHMLINAACDYLGVDWVPVTQNDEDGNIIPVPNEWMSDTCWRNLDLALSRAHEFDQKNPPVEPSPELLEKLQQAQVKAGVPVRPWILPTEPLVDVLARAFKQWRRPLIFPVGLNPPATLEPRQECFSNDVMHLYLVKKGRTFFNALNRQQDVDRLEKMLDHFLASSEEMDLNEPNIQLLIEEMAQFLLLEERTTAGYDLKGPLFLPGDTTVHWLNQLLVKRGYPELTLSAPVGVIKKKVDGNRKEDVSATWEALQTVKREYHDNRMIEPISPELLESIRSFMSQFFSTHGRNAHVWLKPDGEPLAALNRVLATAGKPPMVLEFPVGQEGLHKTVRNRQQDVSRLMQFFSNDLPDIQRTLDDKTIHLAQMPVPESDNVRSNNGRLPSDLVEKIRWLQVEVLGREKSSIENYFWKQGLDYPALVKLAERAHTHLKDIKPSSAYGGWAKILNSNVGDVRKTKIESDPANEPRDVESVINLHHFFKENLLQVFPKRRYDDFGSQAERQAWFEKWLAGEGAHQPREAKLEMAVSVLVPPHPPGVNIIAMIEEGREHQVSPGVIKYLDTAINKHLKQLLLGEKYTIQTVMNAYSDVPEAEGRETRLFEAATEFLSTFLVEDFKTAGILAGAKLLGPEVTWFVERIRTGGSWDYKRLSSHYEKFGNFVYGAVGASIGIPGGKASQKTGDLLGRIGGLIQLIDESGLSVEKLQQYASKNAEVSSKLPWGVAPFGDHERDYELVVEGHLFYAFLISTISL